jgi:hypothetical protein
MALRGLKAAGKPIRFKFLSGDVNWRDYGGKWISQRLNNGQWDYWLVLELTNYVEACGEKEAKEIGGTYGVGLYAVSPAAAGEQELKRALESCGPDDKSEIPDEMKVEALQSYGVSSPLWNGTGNNAYDLLKEARMKAQGLGDDGGFERAMGAYKNRIGHTGWDCIRGDMSLETAIKNRKAWEEKQNQE